MKIILLALVLVLGGCSELLTKEYRTLDYSIDAVKDKENKTISYKVFHEPLGAPIYIDAQCQEPKELSIYSNESGQSLKILLDRNAVFLPGGEKFIASGDTLSSAKQYLYAEPHPNNGNKIRVWFGGVTQQVWRLCEEMIAEIAAEEKAVIEAEKQRIADKLARKEKEEHIAKIKAYSKILPYKPYDSENNYLSMNKIAHAYLYEKDVSKYVNKFFWNRDSYYQVLQKRGLMIVLISYNTPAEYPTAIVISNKDVKRDEFWVLATSDPVVFLGTTTYQTLFGPREALLFKEITDKP